MGRARSVTAIALDEFLAFAAEVQTAVNDGRITDIEAARIRLRGTAARGAISFAHARNEVARLALDDVQDARNIETKCAKARIDPIVFDFGPEAA